MAPLAPVETRDVAAAVPELMPIEQVEPEWDAALVKKLRKGHVNVRLVVGVDGRPTKVEVASSTDPRLGEAALVAVRRWRFVPIEKARAASVDFGFDLGR